MSNTAVAGKKQWTVDEYKRFAETGEFPEWHEKRRVQAPDHSTSRRVSRIDQRHVPDDVCSGKHGGDYASVLAHDRVRHTKREAQQVVIDLLKTHGELTPKEMGAILGDENRNHYAPRCSELKAQSVIERTGEMRGGAYVLRLVRQ